MMQSFLFFSVAFIRVSLVLALFMVALPSSAKIMIKISDAWSPPMPASVSVRAGYFTVSNIGKAEVILTHARSPFFEKIEIHQTNNDAGVMSMSALQSVVIPVADTLHFTPSGLHLMMMGLNRPLLDGAEIPIQIFFSNGQFVQFNMQLKRGYANSVTHTQSSINVFSNPIVGIAG